MVHVRVTTRVVTPEQTGGKELRINCPACGAKNVPAEAWLQEERAQLIWKMTTSWVRCSACGAVLYSRQRADTLFAYSPEELEDIVIQRMPRIRGLLVLLAALTFFIPGLGLAMALIAWIAARKMTPGWRRASRVIMILSLIIHAGLGLLIVLDKMGYRGRSVYDR
jgi:ribosomal protein S27E